MFRCSFSTCFLPSTEIYSSGRACQNWGRSSKDPKASKGCISIISIISLSLSLSLFSSPSLSESPSLREDQEIKLFPQLSSLLLSLRNRSVCMCSTVLQHWRSYLGSSPENLGRKCGLLQHRWNPIRFPVTCPALQSLWKCPGRPLLPRTSCN